MDYVIFSIDNDYDLHTKAKFLREMDTLRAMGKLEGNVSLAIGSYEGALEDSYIVTEADFHTHIKDSLFVANQKTFLYVGGDRRMPYLLVNKGGEVLKTGRLVSKDYVPTFVENYTYRPDLKLYWFDEEEVF
jgi:hypothetical protein